MTEHRTGSVLVVCTGNICRSPYIERLLASALADTGITVSSAGTGALVGHAMHPSSAVRTREAGADPDGFVARQLTADMVKEADLIIAASREHAGEAIALAPRAMKYAFSLPDLADLLEGCDPAQIEAAPGANHVAKVAAAAKDRRGSTHPRQGEDALIVDPYQREESVFTEMEQRVAEFLPPVVAALRG
jgi:protein-tyrosine phosphatase